MKVCFDTFGCRLNKAEALQMEADYLAAGWTTTDKHSEADLIVVRGCSITSSAQRDCEKLIAHIRRKYPFKQLHICGCLKQRSKPGMGSKSGALNSSLRLRTTPTTTTTPTTQPLPTRTARAYLKVQDGCSGKCTFCIVPQFRGSSRSVKFSRVMDKAKRFIDAGYHEIVVTGCNLSLYASEGKRLPDLLTALADLTDSSNRCRIRLGSLEPGACAIETVHAIAEHDNLCNFLHLAVQSGSSAILQAMRRPYTAKNVEELLKLCKTLIPSMGLGCDLMTGFPGETELDFLATEGLLARRAFNNAHIFPFSQRPNTPAYSAPHQIPHEVRFARASRLKDKIKRDRNAFARSFLGKTVEIVVESEKRCGGWTAEYLYCETQVEAPSPIPRKSLARLTVTNVLGDRLYGKLL